MFNGVSSILPKLPLCTSPFGAIQKNPRNISARRKVPATEKFDDKKEPKKKTNKKEWRK